MIWRPRAVLGVAGVLGICALGETACGRNPVKRSEVAVPDPTPTSPLTLRSDRPLALGLGAGKKREVGIDLSRGRFVHVTATQEDLDVKVEVRDPSDVALATVDRPDGTAGPEELFLVAESSGRFVLEISAWDDPPGDGEVALRIEASRPAGREDRRRAWAQSAYSRARAAERNAETPEDRAAVVAGYGEAASLWRRIGDAERETWALDRAGRIEVADPKTRRLGIAKLQLAVDRYPKSHSRLCAGMYSALGSALRKEGDLAGAGRSYERAIGILERLGDAKEVALNFNNLALTRSEEGRVDEPLRIYAGAIETLKTSGTTVPLARVHFNRGNLYWTLGAWHRAVEDHRRALDLLEGLEEPELQAQILNKLGDDLWEIGERGPALERFRRSVLLWRDLEEDHGLAVALNSLGLAELELDRPDAAFAAFSEAAGQMDRAGSPAERAIVLTHLGRTLERLGQPGHARSYLDQAIALGEEGPSATALSGAFLGIARLERLAGRLDVAERWAERAVGEIEARVEGIERPDLRAALVADRREPYGFLVDLLAERHAHEPGRGFDEKAFAVHERLEARVLLELLAAGRFSLDPAAASSLARLAGTINRIHLEQMSRPISSERPRSIVGGQSLGLLLSDYAQKAEAVGTRTGSARSPAPAPALAAVGERLLDDGTLLLEIHLGEESSVLWAVTRSTRRLVKLPAKGIIEQAAEAAFEGLERSRFEVEQVAAEEAAARLSDLLLAPVADLLASRRLVFVVSGKLSQVPFGALPEPTSLGVSPARRKPLILGHEVVTVPSVGVLALLRERRRRTEARRTLAVIADPVFEETDSRLRALGASAVRERLTAGLRTPLRRLEFAGREAEGIVALARSSQPFLALGLAANRSLIARGALADFRILHFATHGLYDDAYPELSALALSSYDESGRPVDGLVRAYEWVNLDLRADLVVASACRTALGGKGALGQLGLTQAFFQAGARQVVVSVWDVEDRATSELMEHFYRALLIERRTPAAALRQAQLRLLLSERWSAPAFWAGFVLAGDWA